MAQLFPSEEMDLLIEAELELPAGIVAVIAGREAPRWEEADNIPIPQQYIDTQLVTHFFPTDADVYLRLAGIGDETLHQSAIAYATVTVNQVHPLLLGLSGDVNEYIRNLRDKLQAFIDNLD